MKCDAISILPALHPCLASGQTCMPLKMGRGINPRDPGLLQDANADRLRSSFSEPLAFSRRAHETSGRIPTLLRPLTASHVCCGYSDLGGDSKRFVRCGDGASLTSNVERGKARHS